VAVSRWSQAHATAVCTDRVVAAHERSVRAQRHGDDALAETGSAHAAVGAAACDVYAAHVGVAAADVFDLFRLGHDGLPCGAGRQDSAGVDAECVARFAWYGVTRAGGQPDVVTAGCEPMREGQRASAARRASRPFPTHKSSSRAEPLSTRATATATAPLSFAARRADVEDTQQTSVSAIRPRMPFPGRALHREPALVKERARAAVPDVLALDDVRASVGARS
jgi:hypothetical protein